MPYSIVKSFPPFSQINLSHDCPVLTDNIQFNCALLDNECSASVPVTSSNENTDNGPLFSVIFVPFGSFDCV